MQTVEFLQHAFAQAGVEARVEISDWPSHSARRDAGDFDLILQGWTQIIDPDRIFFEQMHSRGGLNWGGYRDDELDRLLERGRRMQAPETRDPIYQQAAAIVARDVPYYVISYQQYQVFVQPRVRGFEPDLRGMLRSLARATLAPN